MKMSIAWRTGLGLVLLMLLRSSPATTFCVATTGELQDALNAAESNGADDVIRIKTGTYTSAFPFIAAAFTYDTAQDFDITLQGGWSGNGDTCQRRSRNPAATVLSGSGARAVLRMTGANGSLGDMVIDQLTLRGGNSVDYGAGLRIGGNGGLNGFAGDLVIERVYFDDNASGEWAAGLYVRTRGGVRVRNNVFRSNSCAIDSCAAEINANYLNAVDVRSVVANNTVVGNVCDDGAVSCSTGGILISGTARATAYNNAFALNGGNDLRLLNGTQVDLLFNNINQLSGIPQVNAGNINVINPQFVSLLDDDFRLMPNSPLRNAGASGFTYSSIDHAGIPRVQEGQIDIGAFEFSERIFADDFE